MPAFYDIFDNSMIAYLEEASLRAIDEMIKYLADNDDDDDVECK